MRKPMVDYLLEALGLGLLFGAIALGITLLFLGDDKVINLTWAVCALMTGAGFRLAAGRDLKSTEKPDREVP